MYGWKTMQREGKFDLSVHVIIRTKQSNRRLPDCPTWLCEQPKSFLGYHESLMITYGSTVYLAWVDYSYTESVRYVDIPEYEVVWYTFLQYGVSSSVTGWFSHNNNNRYRIACYSIELNASVDYMKPSFAIKSMNHCIFNRELDTG